jgi:hypothetical protein
MAYFVYQAFSHPSRSSHGYESPRSSEAFRFLGNVIEECVADKLSDWLEPARPPLGPTRHHSSAYSGRVFRNLR